MLKTIVDGIRTANEEWQKGFNCAESVLRGVCHFHDIDLPDIAKRMATPFGGGIGRCEDVCGALTGGVMGIGAVLGRADATGDKTASRVAAARLYSEFAREFGSVRCSDLNKGDFDSPQHKPRCGRFVEGATRFSLEAIEHARL